MDHPLRHLGPFPSLQVMPAPQHLGARSLDLLTVHTEREETGAHELVDDPANLASHPFTLQFHGGPTVPQPKLVLVWAGAPAMDKARLQQFAHELMEYGYLAQLGYAGCTGGSYLGSVDGPTLAPGTYGTAQLESYLAALVPSCAFPPATGVIYALMLPDEVVAQFEGTQQHSCPNPSFCGYHSSMANGSILYSVQPSCNCSGCNQGDPFAAQCMTLAHEVAETVADPTGQGWYADADGFENADEVAWIPLTWGPWTVQGYGSPDGQNLVGAYSPPAQPQPQPQGDGGAAVRVILEPLWSVLRQEYAGRPAAVVSIKQWEAYLCQVLQVKQ